VSSPLQLSAAEKKKLKRKQKKQQQQKESSGTALGQARLSSVFMCHPYFTLHYRYLFIYLLGNNG
jgi:hypothetical protein